MLLIIGLILSLQACRDNTQHNVKIFTPTVSIIKPTYTPTSVISEQPTLTNYTHSDNRFKINYPNNWEFFEQPDSVVFVEPANQIGYSVVFNDVGIAYNSQELNQYLVTFVAQNFVKEGLNFEAINQEQHNDGMVVAQFSFIDSDLGPAISEVRVLQKDTIVFVIHISTPEEQWPISYNTLQALANSFVPLDTSPIVASQPVSESPSWTLIGPDSQEFGFLYATNWEIVEQSTNVVLVRQSETGMTFEAAKFIWPQASSNSKAAEKAALAHIEALIKEYSDVQHLPLTEFPLDTATGATIDFLYTTNDGTAMAGSVITAVSDGKMYKVVFTAPADFYKTALQWFNPMYKSFKFLKPEDLFVDEP